VEIEQSGTPPSADQEVKTSDSSRGSQPPHQQQGPRHGVDISVVIPLLNEDESLKELYEQLRTTLKRMSVRYELLFIDDGSTDRSFQVLRELKRNDARIKIIRFRRNYGKSAALSVGFEKSQAPVIITMDADLQDDPAEIPNLVRKLNEGYDLISGWKKVRRDPLSKKIPSRFFNLVTSLLTGIKLHDFNCGLKAYRRDVVKTVKVYGELHRYVPALAKWEGFVIGELPVQHRARKYGRTKFGLGRFWKGFLDLVTVLFTTRYFRNPLHLFGFWGVCAIFAGLVIDIWLAVEWFLGQTALSNRPLFLVGILFIIVGIQIVSIGLLGEMITKARQAEEQYTIRDFIR
jgi:glycosyltransferase involved in cell wall biosynthesis